MYLVIYGILNRCVIGIEGDCLENWKSEFSKAINRYRNVIKNFSRYI